VNAFDTQIGGTHYSKYKIQPTEFLITNRIKFAEGNAIKYILRHEDKEGIKDILKAIHYIAMIVETIYPDEKEIQKRIAFVLEEKSMEVPEQSTPLGVFGHERPMPVCDLRPKEAVERDASRASSGREDERSPV